MRKFKFNKKYITVISILISLIICINLCIFLANKKYNDSILDSKIIEQYQTILIADGGNGKDIPKNTIYSVDDLIGKGYSFMKIDARLTADKKWVALESRDISCVTDGKGNVDSYNYYELMNFNLKNFREEDHPIIDTVSRVAKYAKENGIAPMIFLHNNSKKDVKNLVNELYEIGIDSQFYFSENLSVLQYIAKINTTAVLYYYVDEITEEAMLIAEEDSRFLICFNSDNKKNDKEKVEEMIERDIGFLCYGAETLTDIESLYKIGVRFFICDTLKAG